MGGACEGCGATAPTPVRTDPWCVCSDCVPQVLRARIEAREQRVRDLALEFKNALERGDRWEDVATAAAGRVEYLEKHIVTLAETEKRAREGIAAKSEENGELRKMYADEVRELRRILSEKVAKIQETEAKHANVNEALAHALNRANRFEARAKTLHEALDAIRVPLKQVEGHQLPSWCDAKTMAQIAEDALSEEARS
jgi:hypothetical protein